MNRSARKLHAAILVVGVLLVYGNSLEGSFHYDDFHSITLNPHIRDLGNIPAFFAEPQLFSADPAKGMYRPLLLTTYALNYAAGEYEVGGYHLVNLLLHLCCVLLVWVIGSRLGCGERGALLAGLLFAVHPLVTEPVNYISSRSESLAACFFLGAFALFIAASRWQYGAALFCFAAGLLTKSVVVSLLPVLALYEWQVSGKPFRLGRQLPFWGVGAVYLAVIAGNRFLGNSLAAAPRGWGEQLWTQCKGLVYYFKLLSMPVGLNVEHQFFAVENPFQVPVLSSICLLLSLLFFGSRLASRRSFFWLAWAVITLMPATVVPLNVLVNEHRLYLPLAGLALLVGQNWKRLEEMVRMQQVALVLILVLGALAFQRNRIWGDELSLWEDAAAGSPEMPRVHVHLGNALRERGDWIKARDEYQAALRLEPEHRAARTNLGNLFFEAGEREQERAGEYWQKAAGEYERVLAVDPEYQEALNNLGSVYMMLGKLGDAERIYHQTVERHPNFADAYFNLGLVTARQERYGEAIGHFRRALELSADAETYFELGNAQVRTGELEGAADAYRRAIRLQKGDVRFLNNLAGVLLVLGESRLQAGDSAGGMEMWQEARQHLHTVVGLSPNFGQAAEKLKSLETRLR